MKILHILLLLLLSLIFLAIFPTMAFSPACQNMCGNVAIPYPFGTHESCSLNEDFLIYCNPTTKIPYLYGGAARVLEISLQGIIQAPTKLSYTCYNKTGVTDSKLEDINVGGIYTTSEFNKLVGLGCDSVAASTGRTLDGESWVTGCVSFCLKNSSKINGSCSGYGCCQGYFPESTYRNNIALDTFLDHKKVLEFNPCTYGFIVKDGAYRFDPKHLNLAPKDLAPIIKSLPTIYNWNVGNTSCQEAKRNQSNYLCKDAHSVCKDSRGKRNGYLCHCIGGYRGNPYIQNGCKDVDECASPDLNDCINPMRCRNTVGNYTCLCENGDIGDGRKKGEGCIPQHKQSSKFDVLVGVLSGLGFLCALAAVWFLYKRFKRWQRHKLRQKYFRRNGGLLLEQQLSSSTTTHVGQTNVFTCEELETATGNYSENRILGQGGQGTVYKGMLSDGRVVAVKKSKAIDGNRLDQFINEVVLLSRIDHRHIVKLFGCCLESEFPLLVYEFLPNGTLFELLHSEDHPEFLLTWGQRLEIAGQVAGAFAYLHSGISVPIFHRDIKSSNLLLDDKYRAKVADFGMSMEIQLNETHITAPLQGTFGYFDPEYSQSGHYTEKSEVYSFGVVLVELLTGLKPYSVEREERNLGALFRKTMQAERVLEIVDQRVLKEARGEEIIGVAELARRCVELEGSERPSMKEVEAELNKIRGLDGASSSKGKQKQAIVSDDSEEEVAYSGPLDATCTLTR